MSARAGFVPGCVRLAIALLGALANAPAAAQDFSTVAAPVHRMLEDGQVSPVGGFAAEAGLVQWHRIAGLATRSIALGGSWGIARAAAGVSQSGDPELGWMTAGTAFGVATSHAGAGLRALLRREQSSAAAATALGRGAGAEAGFGAWAMPRPGLVLWASAPQAWRRGAAPPLARALEVGARFEGGGVAGWIARAAPPTPLERDGRHRAGLALAAGPWRLWLEARDRPLRGGVGVAGALGGLRVAGAVEGHPVLDETVRLAVGWGGGPW